MQQPTLDSLSLALERGETTSRDLVETCLERISDPAGEGSRAFIGVAAASARRAADRIDRLRKSGDARSPYAGIPVAIKDLFDVKGEVTAAGSTVLKASPAASRDATSVERLRAAGFVVIGRTNMTEFAYSGLGLNPHYGTPRSMFDRETGRAPGGSTSGGAIAVADAMAHLALGTDTGGSCRIPAAFNGLVGWKPTASRVPLDGCLPLSPSLDSIGPIGRSVKCCVIADAILADELRALRPTPPLSSLRLLVPMTLVFDGIDVTVARSFETAISLLSKAGAVIEQRSFSLFESAADVNRLGGLPAAESYAWHATIIENALASYDPRVLVRILRGKEQSARDYLELIALRRALVSEFEPALKDFDALVLPTVAIIPPKLSELSDDADYTRTNSLVLRNTSLINILDGCAISLPVSKKNDAPVGLMVAAPRGHDGKTLSLAAAIEAAL